MAPSVMANWTAVLLPAADAGITSIDTAMLTASRNARRRFFIVLLLVEIIAKPLPLGEVASECETERASRLTKEEHPCPLSHLR